MANEQISTTTNFNLPVDEIVEFALGEIGGKHYSHEEARKARTALNLVLIDMQNRGMVPLASMQIKEVTLASGSADNYQVSQDAINVLDAVIEVSSSNGQVTDYPLTRLSMTEWLSIPNKYNNNSRPTHFLVNKQRNNILLNFWPEPNANNFTFKAWCLTQTKDVNKGFQLVDMPTRYLDAIVKGLAYRMAASRGIPIQERQWLKQEFEMALENAFDEDRERVDMSFYPAHVPQLGGV